MPRISRLTRDEVLPGAVTIYDRYLRDRGNVPNTFSHYGAPSSDHRAHGGHSQYRTVSKALKELVVVRTSPAIVLPLMQ